jgi:fucose permease
MEDKEEEEEKKKKKKKKEKKKKKKKKKKKTSTLISAHNMFTIFCSYIGKQVKAKSLTIQVSGN